MTGHLDHLTGLGASESSLYSGLDYEYPEDSGAWGTLRDPGPAAQQRAPFRWERQIVGQVIEVGPSDDGQILSLSNLPPAMYTLNVQELGPLQSTGATGDRAAVGQLKWGLGGAQQFVEFDVRRGITLPVRCSNLLLNIRNDGLTRGRYSAQIAKGGGTPASGGRTPLTRTFSFVPWAAGDSVTVPPFAVSVLPLLNSDQPAGDTILNMFDVNANNIFELRSAAAVGDRRHPTENWIPLPAIVDNMSWDAVVIGEPAHFIFSLLL